MPPPSIAISCFIADAPRFHLQAWLWLEALAGLERGQPTELVLHCDQPLPVPLRDKARATGARIARVAAFGAAEARYCNKLQQLGPLASCGAAHVVLCDTDLGFLESPRMLIEGHAFHDHVIRAKPVDLPNPPPERIAALLAAAGLPGAALSGTTDFDRDGITHPLNCNGGLYLLPAACLGDLAPAWIAAARFCLAQEAILGPLRLHADQLGFMLAMIRLGLPFAPLDKVWNYPLHFPPRRYAAAADPDCRPWILHYHDRLDPQGTLLAPSEPGPAGATAAFNDRHAAARRDPGFAALLARCRETG